MPPKKLSPLQRILRPSVPVTLDVDGEKRTFKIAFDFVALGRFEEKTGVNCLTDGPWVKMGVGKLCAMFWAGTLMYQPELDSQEGFLALQSLLNADNSLSVFEACWNAYLLYLPPAEAESLRRAREEHSQEASGDSTENPTPASSTPEVTGSTSGPSPDSTSASLLASSAN